MEIKFNQPKQHVRQAMLSKGGKFKGRSKSSSNTNKFIGVRQRPSGRYVAEIKDTTQNIRMWLGTFETAEEAARAYDEAACLLRGSNTRTNFATHVSLDSPLASRIRNLLNNKKGTKKQDHVDASATRASINTNNNATSTTTTSTSTSTTSTNTTSTSSSTNSSSDNTLSSGTTQVSDDAYRPDLSNFRDCESHESGLNSNFSWGFEPVLDGFPFAHVLDIPNPHHHEAAGLEVSEFERMKVERQISASLYAMNGVQEYMETVQDSSEVLWDLPPLCSSFC